METLTTLPEPLNFLLSEQVQFYKAANLFKDREDAMANVSILQTFKSAMEDLLKARQNVDTQLSALLAQFKTGDTVAVGNAKYKVGKISTWLDTTNRPYFSYQCFGLKDDLSRRTGDWRWLDLDALKTKKIA